MHKNKSGDTALHIAARNNHKDTVDELLTADPDLGLENKNGSRPVKLPRIKKFKQN